MKRFSAAASLPRILHQVIGFALLMTLACCNSPRTDIPKRQGCAKITPPAYAVTLPVGYQDIVDSELRMPFESAVNAAIKGDTRMQNHLAIFFRRCGDVWNPAAEYWFRQSMALGNHAAQYSLGGWLESSDEPVRKAEGIRLIQDLADRGYKEAIDYIRIAKQMGWWR